MAERFISPGVFTRENDLSFLGQGVAEIGGVFVGPTTKGPAFRPTSVRSLESFTAIFGDSTGESYVPLAVKSYLREASQATVVRILGLDGYNSATARSRILRVSGSGGQYVAAVIHPTVGGVSLVTGSAAGNAAQFTLVLSGSTGLETFTSVSLDPTNTNYITKVLGTSPKGGEDGFVYLQFPGAANLVSGALAGSGSVTLIDAPTQLNFSGSIYGTYRNARTPWIRSQDYAGTKYNLFRFHTLSDGTASNTDVKVSIASIKPATLPDRYGTFSVIVRRFSDTDSKLEVLEQFDNLTLDPTDANFIGRRIGTARTMIDENNDLYFDGDYENNSRYIYVEMDENYEALPIDALPYGFAALAAPVFALNVPAPSYVTTRYVVPNGGGPAVANNRTYYGFNFSDTTSLAYVNPTPSGSVDANGNTLVTGVGDNGFDLLEDLAVNDLSDVNVTTATALRKFTVPFQGGFDGFNPAVEKGIGSSITSTNLFGFDLSTSTTAGSRAYKLALDILSNPDAWDFNLLVLPGVLYEQHPYVAQLAIDMVESRADAFYIMDAAGLNATVTAVTSVVNGLDTNYAGVYYPWIKILDPDTNRIVWVPPSVLMPAVYAFNDRIAAEWFAPAGLNRGGLTEARQVRKHLDQGNRDVLYENRVNPIAQFPSQGIAVWGQKTLQQRASALDRINVRRLLITVKKFIASTARFLVFEQNVEATRQRFLSIVNPYLANVQERLGLFAFRVQMSDVENTNDLIDRNILVGKIYLQPARSAEFISLEFNVLPTGATFEE
jgi:hypothetical protein